MKIIDSYQILKLSDGGEVCLDWLDCEKGKESSHPTVLFMPGLTGNSQSEYIKVNLYYRFKIETKIYF